MKTLFESISQTILNNPTANSWVINISKQNSGEYRIRHSQDINFWYHNLGYSSVPLKDRNISISMLADLFVNSGLLTNIKGGTHDRLRKEIYIIQIRETKNKDHNRSPEWERLWYNVTKVRVATQEKLIKKARTKLETTKLTKTIIDTLKREPYATNWLISLPSNNPYSQQSLNNVTKVLSQENFHVYYSRITCPWMNNQEAPQMALNINRKKNNEFTFLKIYCNKYKTNHR